MDYPNDFDTATFPAGKGIALSRGVAVRISIVFFLILCACGFVLFFTHFKSNYPFLITSDPFTNEWSVITYPGKHKQETIAQYQIIQEKLVSDFVKNWFTISGNVKENEMRWQECSVDECASSQQYNPNNQECTLFCMSDKKIFETFTEKVLPEYTARMEQASEQWNVERRGYPMIVLVPQNVTENGSLWQVRVQIHSSISGYFNVIAFVKVARSKELYPVTLGYYIKDFNAYRIK